MNNSCQKQLMVYHTVCCRHPCLHRSSNIIAAERQQVSKGTRTLDYMSSDSLLNIFSEVTDKLVAFVIVVFDTAVTLINITLLSLPSSLLLSVAIYVHWNKLIPHYVSPTLGSPGCIIPPPATFVHYVFIHFVVCLTTVP